MVPRETMSRATQKTSARETQSTSDDTQASEKAAVCTHQTFTLVKRHRCARCFALCGNIVAKDVKRWLMWFVENFRQSILHEFNKLEFYEATRWSVHHCCFVCSWDLPTEKKQQQTSTLRTKFMWCVHVQVWWLKVIQGCCSIAKFGLGLPGVTGSCAYRKCVQCSTSCSFSFPPLKFELGPARWHAACNRKIKTPLIMDKFLSQKWACHEIREASTGVQGISNLRTLQLFENSSNNKKITFAKLRPWTLLQKSSSITMQSSLGFHCLGAVSNSSVHVSQYRSAWQPIHVLMTDLIHLHSHSGRCLYQGCSRLIFFIQSDCSFLPCVTVTLC